MNWIQILGAGILLSACSASVEYGAGGANQLMTGGGDSLAVAEIMDGRRMGEPSPKPLISQNDAAMDMAALRRSVRQHAVRAGLSAPQGWVPSAPNSAVEVAEVLNEAKGRGAEVVLFTRLDGLFAGGAQAGAVTILTAINYLTIIGIGAVGLLPSLIVFSLPINTEYSAAGVRAFLVDPSNGTVLATFKETHVFEDNSVTAWGYGPAGEISSVLFQTMEKVFARAAQLVTSQQYPAQLPGSAATLLFEPQYSPVFAGDAQGRTVSLR